MGKGGEGAAQQQKENSNLNEVLIKGRLYDVTTLKHPGGSVIKLYSGNGIDATEAFMNFHVRSQKAQKFLASLPSREAGPVKDAIKGQSELMKDFAQLTSDLEKEGYFKPSYLHMLYRFSEIILMHAIGAYLLFHNHYTLGIIILGIVCGRCGWLMHEGGHYSLTGNIAIDRQLQIWLYGVGCGMSGGWWRIQHNKHHSMPQKIGVDVDLDTLPLVAFTSKIVKKAGFPQKFWIRLQGYLFPVITCLLVAMGWQFFLHPRFIIRTKNYSEMAALVTRYAIWGYFFVPYFGVWGAIQTYLLYTWIAADYIFLNFALSHTHLPTVPKEDTETDWIRYSSIHTMNVYPGPFNFVNWWMGYLNFQIEHHLFPCMPQYRFPKLSPRIKVFFEKHGLVYDRRSYFDAWDATFKNLHKVGDEVFLG